MARHDKGEPIDKLNATWPGRGKRFTPQAKGEVVITNQDIAYAIGLGDRVSRLAYEQERSAGRRFRYWHPASYTTDRNRAIELLPEGEIWDNRAEGMTAREVCDLALKAKAEGHKPRLIPATTSGYWYEGKKVGVPKLLDYERLAAARTEGRLAKAAERSRLAEAAKNRSYGGLYGPGSPMSAPGGSRVRLTP